MSSKIETLYTDAEKTNALYPRTKLSAVSNDDGEALSELLKGNLCYFGDGEDTPIIDETLNKIYPVGSVYFSVDNTNPSTLFGGTWELIGTKLAISENVFGNGTTLALTEGTNLIGSNSHSSIGFNLASGFGRPVGINTAGIQQPFIGDTTIGVPTKAQLGDNPQYSGLIVDTETIYSWKRVS